MPCLHGHSRRRGSGGAGYASPRKACTSQLVAVCNAERMATLSLRSVTSKVFRWSARLEGPLSTLPRTHETSAGPCNGMRTTLNLLQCSRFRVPQRAAESPPALRLALHLHQPPRFPGPQERRHSSCSAALRATCMPLACVFRIC